MSLYAFHLGLISDLFPPLGTRKVSQNLCAAREFACDNLLIYSNYQMLLRLFLKIF